jgi:hypothetical protein
MSRHSPNLTPISAPLPIAIVGPFGVHFDYGTFVLAAAAIRIT